MMATHIEIGVSAPRDGPGREPLQDLARQGIDPCGTVQWNLLPARLVETAIRRGEGHLADHGPFVGITSPHTGRSPKDKFVVRDGP